MPGHPFFITVRRCTLRQTGSLDLGPPKCNVKAPCSRGPAVWAHRCTCGLLIVRCNRRDATSAPHRRQTFASLENRALRIQQPAPSLLVAGDIVSRRSGRATAPQTEDAGAAEAATVPTASPADSVELAVKWQKQEITIHVEPTESVQGIKRKLEAATSVSEKRMKLLGLKVRSGKPAGDADVVADLLLKPGTKIMMMGTAEADIDRLNKDAEVAPHVQDDFDIQEEGIAEIAELKDRPEVQEKLARRVASCNVKVLNPPRPGKKLLVADIDYTIFDLNSTAERAEELARPFLHEFFSAIYADYDIVIWSATSMKWVEVKMRELGVSTHPDYKLTFMLDHLAMITVQHPKYGLFDCKPLQFIWSKFPEHYGPHNTIMLDDLRRNYVLNTQNGLVIRPFKKAHLTRGTDRELLYLSAYLTKIAALDSLEGLNHKHWESYAKVEIRQLRKQLEAQQQAEQQQGGSGAGGS